MAKLTLSVEEEVIARAKEFAAEQGMSVSELVERYLDFVSRPADSSLPRGLRSVRGVLRSGDRDAFRRHLDSKHR
ncbi:MAG TPA: DUF6364 family protein [Thermoanaerobaculia bacterium]